MTSPIEQDEVVQQQVFAFLAAPATHGVIDVRRVETHAAVVFLAGNRALKVKRAIRFPFLDYSTLAKRKMACDEEIRINRPVAPQIYRRVVAITRDREGSFGIDGSGPPVEYAIEMFRFDERSTLDHLAQAGALDPAFVENLADVIAASHKAAPVIKIDGWIHSIPSIIAANTTSFRASGRFPAGDIETLDAASLAAFAPIQACLERRYHRGLVRRCHGDLHLGNIVRIADKPVPFDAIEFDPALASIDILYDLSFTLMDLLHYGRRSEANLLLNRYLTTTFDDNVDGLATLPLFMSVRAAVRANVLLARLNEADGDGTTTLSAARRYFALACQLVSPSPPTLVAIGGLSGTGKTVLARALAGVIDPAPGAVILRSDIARKQYFHVRDTEKLPASAYQPEMSEVIYKILTDRAEQILSQGHSVILDAVFAKPSERLAAAAIARKFDLPFAGLFLVSDLATRTRRVGQRSGDASDATVDLVKHQEEYDIGSLDWHTIDASGRPEQTLQRSRVALGKPETHAAPIALEPQ